MEEETLPCMLNTGALGINLHVCSAGGEPGTTKEKRHQNFSNYICSSSHHLESRLHLTVSRVALPRQFPAISGRVFRSR